MSSNKNENLFKSIRSRFVRSIGKKIAEAARKAGAEIAGPMPLPTKIKKYTVLRFSAR